MRHVLLRACNNSPRLPLSCSIASIILIHYISSTYGSTNCDSNSKNASTANTNSDGNNSTNTNTEQKGSSAGNKVEFSYNNLGAYFRNFYLGDVQTHKNIQLEEVSDQSHHHNQSRNSCNISKNKMINPKSLNPVELNDTTFMSRFGVDNNNILPKSHVGAFSVSGLESTPRYFLLDGDFSSNKLVIKDSKINQDRGSVVIPYGDSKSALFAVYDGHGKVGHKVSQFVCEEIKKKLQSHEQFYSNLPKALTETFESVNNELKNAPIEYPIYSGTTAVVVLLCKDILYISNVGDSRAVLGERKKESESRSNKYTHINLSTDHKPDNPSERQRIEDSGGYVSSVPLPGYTARAWSCKERVGLGLAMSRSIGDFALKSTGVIPSPEINIHPLSLLTNDQFVVLASDGVWDFCTSQEAVDIVGTVFDSGGTANEACRELTRICVNRWMEKSDDYRDDVTVIVVRLNDLLETVFEQLS